MEKRRLTVNLPSGNWCVSARIVLLSLGQFLDQWERELFKWFGYLYVIRFQFIQNRKKNRESCFNQESSHATQLIFAVFCRVIKFVLITSRQVLLQKNSRKHQNIFVNLFLWVKNKYLNHNSFFPPSTRMFWISILRNIRWKFAITGWNFQIRLRWAKFSVTLMFTELL